MSKYLNGSNVPLSMAVFLATDDYDYEPGVISATKLIKPLRQIILAGRVPQADAKVDIAGLVKSRMGQAIHGSIEAAWLKNYKQAMRDLGYPEKVIERVRVNPDPKTVKEGDIPVYLEQRAYRTVFGKKVSGKFDMVADGRVEDFKTTSTFTWVNGTKDADYRMQGSLYRWLNPDIITDDHMAINFLFTDYMPGRAANDPNYPQSPTPQKLIPLMSLDETDAFVKNKLRVIETFKDAPEEDLPLCSNDELWQKPPVWKYYKNPQKLGRATKNFEDKQEAYNRLAADGGKGVVIEQPGEVQACKYCPAFPVCSQKDDLIAQGLLKI